MKELNKQELLQLSGGATISGTLINAFVRGIDIIMEVGRSFGSAIRRWQGKQICPI